MRPIIIESDSDLISFLNKWNTCDCIIHPIFSDNKTHHFKANLSLIIIKFINKDDYIIPIRHNESTGINFDLSILNKNSTNNRFCFDKKALLYIFKNDLNFKDLNINNFINSKDIINIDKFDTIAHNYINSKFYSSDNINEIIPIFKHYEQFNSMCSTFDINFSIDSKYNNWNDKFINVLYKLESSGLCIDQNVFIDMFGDKSHNSIHDGFVYSYYNFYTSTSRPSNCFNNINYSALKKDNGERKSFVSRFGKDGGLFSIDYSAFHPRLIGKLSDYDLPCDVDVYEYLGKFLHNKEILTVDEIAVSKQAVFRLMYGGIEEDFKIIPYFKKMSDYTDLVWETSVERGYAETPFFKRKIKLTDVEDITKSKLLNYIIQSAETENNVDVMVNILDYLNDKYSKYILYTYDNFMFDVCKDDQRSLMIDLKDIIQGDKKFPVKCYFGKNYGEMTKMKL